MLSVYSHLKINFYILVLFAISTTQETKIKLSAFALTTLRN